MKTQIKYIILSIIAGCLFHLAGCTSQKGHEILVFFFDDVQDSDSLSLQKDTVAKQASKTPLIEKNRAPAETIYKHFPYENKECSACHDIQNAYKLVSVTPDLCYNCHEDFAVALKHVHGPVSAGYCNKCHEPHTSKNANLISRKGRQLCFYCHESKDVLANPVHDISDEQLCWECHNPHGGMTSNMLKQ